MAEGAEFTVHGLTEAVADLRELGPRVARVAGERLATEAEVNVMTPSKERCPVDTGTLRSTGHVDKPEISAEGIKVTVGYGGPAAPYALYVHERLETKLGNEIHHPVGGAKFLESVMNENGEAIINRVIKDAMAAV